jgi:hypothetical protein
MSVIALFFASISHSFNCGQGFVGAASRYLGLRSMMSLLGPMYYLIFNEELIYVLAVFYLCLFVFLIATNIKIK